MIEFTGERVVPGQVEVDLWNEHVARYAFASQFAAEKLVLDIGCGSGYGAAELGRTARAVVGIDISVEAIQYARARFPMETLHLAAASASALPCVSSTFDLVTAFEVIEHLHAWPELIEEASRVLAPSGLFIVSTPNKNCYTASRGAQGENPFHVHEFEASEFENALTRVFPHAQLLAQNRSEAFVIYPPKGDPDATAHIDSTAGDAHEAHFFIAVCSKQPIEPVRWFVWLPRVANVLAERELHIAKLQDELKLNQRWLEESRTGHALLLAEHERQQAHLEAQNLWALDLEAQWKSAQRRIVELQDEFAAAQQAATAAVRQYQSTVADLETANHEKTQWAQALAAEVEHFRTQLTENIRLKDAAEAELEQRTRWALDLQKKLEYAEARIAGAKASRWVRSGRLFGIGPEL